MFKFAQDFIHSKCLQQFSILQQTFKLVESFTTIVQVCQILHSKYPRFHSKCPSEAIIFINKKQVHCFQIGQKNTHNVFVAYENIQEIWFVTLHKLGDESRGYSEGPWWSSGQHAFLQASRSWVCFPAGVGLNSWLCLLVSPSLIFLKYREINVYEIYHITCRV